MKIIELIVQLQQTASEGVEEVFGPGGAELLIRVERPEPERPIVIIDSASSDNGDRVGI